MNPRYITSRIFERHYKQRISKNENLIEDFLESTEAFLDDPKLVHDHSLKEIMKDE